MIIRAFCYSRSNDSVLQLARKYHKVRGYAFNPLSPKSDQYQISLCNINAL